MKNHIYEIKNAQGEVVYTTTIGDFALSHYYLVRNETGYAEAWYNGECFFKTR